MATVAKSSNRGSKPGERRGGRVKGTPNKTTATVKEALIQAFEQRGGVPSLILWAEDNPTEFYKLWGRMLPQEVNADLNVSGDLANRLAAAWRRGGAPASDG
jgi:hypothetical protein